MAEGIAIQIKDFRGVGTFQKVSDSLFSTGHWPIKRSKVLTEDEDGNQRLALREVALFRNGPGNASFFVGRILSCLEDGADENGTPRWVIIDRPSPSKFVSKDMVKPGRRPRLYDTSVRSNYVS